MNIGAVVPVKLSVVERDTLSGTDLSLTIEPVSGVEGEYWLTPGSTVGAVEIGDLSFLIKAQDWHPAICCGWPPTLSAKSIFESRTSDFPEGADSLPDVSGPCSGQPRRGGHSPAGCSTGTSPRRKPCTPCGVVSGSMNKYGAGLVSLCRSKSSIDEFTDDILANRLVKAAGQRLRRMRLRSP